MMNKAAAAHLSKHQHSRLHAIVLTFNEEKHIRRCLDSIAAHCDTVTVIDSGSQDKTVEIVKTCGADVLHRDWVNHSVQMNRGIEYVNGRGGWVFRIDADEVFDAGSLRDIREWLNRQEPEVSGVEVDRRIHFMGKEIRHGGVAPSWQLRVWRNGMGVCENRWMDEHIVVTGRTVRAPFKIHDINLNPLGWWVLKHEGYASREAIDVLCTNQSGEKELPSVDRNLHVQAKFKRFLKGRVYNKMPSGLRSGLYFFYRFLLRGGFLDGPRGYYFHFFQGFWYRTLVDAKVIEILDTAIRNDTDIATAIQKISGIEVQAMSKDRENISCQAGQSLKKVRQ